ncbi:MAG: M24 family metallopeptidase, partial [Mycoplasmatales bacterium]
MNYNNLLKEHNVDAIWVTNKENKRYISGFTGSDCEVIISHDKVLFMTDGRYKTAVKNEIKKGVEIQIIESNGGYQKAVFDILKDFKTVGIEANDLTVAKYNNITSTLTNLKVVSLVDVFEKIRICKDEEEIKKTKLAVQITDDVFKYVVKNIKPGMSEIEVKLMIENQHIINGAEGQSFDPIVASGTNSALPHAHPTSKIIEDGDILTIDFGCFKDGYCSDMTRTFFVGEVKNEEIIKIHNLVLETMNLQISHVKAGISCNEIDAVGRKHMKDNGGYDKYFIHGTGHGIGLQVHEEPYVNKVSKTILEPGM